MESSTTKKPPSNHPEHISNAKQHTDRQPRHPSTNLKFSLYYQTRLLLLQLAIWCSKISVLNGVLKASFDFLCLQRSLTGACLQEIVFNCAAAKSFTVFSTAAELGRKTLYDVICGSLFLKLPRTERVTVPAINQRPSRAQTPFSFNNRGRSNH